MNIHFYSPNRIEAWDYRNVFNVGIGGSETSHVEMALRLAARGHEVTSYTDLPLWPEDDPGFDPEFGGVHWRDLSEADLSADGLWIIYRSPETGPLCVPSPTRVFWFVAQDIYYSTWTPENMAPFSRILALCPDHKADIEKRDPSTVGRITMSSNGVNVEAIERAEAEAGPRNPRRIVWLSSPDRGLKEVLDIFERAQETVEDLELHVYYGLDNIEKMCQGDRTRWPWVQTWQQYDRAHGMRGVTWHGRIGQDALKQALFEGAIWLYPTWFCVTGDTLVDVVGGPPAPIADLAGRTDLKVWCFDEDEARFRHAPVEWVKRTRENVEVWRVTLADGTSIRATPDHKFLLYPGDQWKELQDLDPAVDCLMGRGHADEYDHRFIASVEPDGHEDVYDLLVDGPHNFVANGVVVHNSETSCIACMEAQACGLVPITRPFWAVGHNVRFGGIFVEGEPADPLVKARYVDAVVRVALDVDSQERVRAKMMPAARDCFTWERWADQWEVLAYVDMGQHDMAAARIAQIEGEAAA